MPKVTDITPKAGKQRRAVRSAADLIAAIILFAMSYGVWWLLDWAGLITVLWVVWFLLIWNWVTNVNAQD